MKSKIGLIDKQAKICKDFRELAERQGYKTPVDVETKFFMPSQSETIRDQVDVRFIDGKPVFITSVPESCLFEDSKRLLNM